MVESPLFQKFNIPLYQDDEIVEEEEETFGPFVSSLFYSENETIQSGYSSALSAVAMEVDNEAEVVGATEVEVEVEDIPLEEDQEFRRTILRPESNMRPTGDEWIVPIVLFQEPIVDNQQETSTTVPMEVEEEQSPVSMEHPVHQQQQQPSTEHLADKDALTKKVSEKKVSKRYYNC
jgi:hypothetical protein